jgi:hypothetical protein
MLPLRILKRVPANHQAPVLMASVVAQSLVVNHSIKPIDCHFKQRMYKSTNSAKFDQFEPLAMLAKYH